MTRRASLGLIVMLTALFAGCGSGAPNPAKQARSTDTLFLEGPAKGNPDRLVALDIHPGRARTLPIMVGCGDATDCFIPGGGELVIASGRTSVYDPRRPGRPRVRHIGYAWSVVPSATDGRVWLALRDHRKKVRGIWPALKLRAVREVTADGRVTRTARAPGLDWWPGGPGNFPEGAVKSGLVFVTEDGVRVWNVRRRKVTVRVPGTAPTAVDTYRNLIAWCGDSCRELQITDARTGRTRSVRPPAGYSFEYEGAFSPDGSLLALPVVPKSQAEHSDRARWSMALASVRGRRARIVMGSRLDSAYHAMSWSASDGRLFFSAGGGKIVAYRPGAPEATKIGRVHGPIFHMAGL